MCITSMTCLSFFWSLTWFIFTSSCVDPMSTSTRSGTFQQFPRIPVLCFGFTIWVGPISKNKLLALFRDTRAGRKRPVCGSLIPFAIIIDTKPFSKYWFPVKTIDWNIFRPSSPNIFRAITNKKSVFIDESVFAQNWTDFYFFNISYPTKTWHPMMIFFLQWWAASLNCPMIIPWESTCNRKMTFFNIIIIINIDIRCSG